jgi:hypothetical protein
METLLWATRIRMPPPCLTLANKLAKRDLGGGASETASTIIGRVTTEIINDHAKVAKTFLRQSKLAKASKLDKGRQQKRTGADEGGGKGLGGAPVEINPAVNAVVAEDVEEHVGDADGKAKCKRGKCNCGRGGQGAKSGPGRQQAASVAVQGRPSGAPRENEQISFPVTTTYLTFLYLVNRGELKWTNNSGLHTTKLDLHIRTNPLHKPLGAVRLGETPDGPLNVLWTTVGDVSVRHPPLIVAPALTMPSLWALSPAPLNPSRSGSYTSDKGIRIPQF